MKLEIKSTEGESDKDHPKVYLVLDCVMYEGCNVVAAFSSDEKAKAFVEADSDRRRREGVFLPDDYKIEEWNVDENQTNPGKD